MGTPIFARMATRVRRPTSAGSAPQPVVTEISVRLSQDIHHSILKLAMSSPSEECQLAAVCRSCQSFVRTNRLALKPMTDLLSCTAQGTFYPCVVHLDLSDHDWVDDAFLRALSVSKKLPRLSSVNVSGCIKVSSGGIRALFKARGKQLHSFQQDITITHSLCKEMRITPATLKVLGAAQSLTTISLTLGSQCRDGSLAPLANLSLTSMSLFFEGFHHISLPGSLRTLENLQVKTSEWSRFVWSTVAECQYPALKRFVIDDRSGISMRDVPHFNPGAICLSTFGRTGADPQGPGLKEFWYYLENYDAREPNLEDAMERGEPLDFHSIFMHINFGDGSANEGGLPEEDDHTVEQTKCPITGKAKSLIKHSVDKWVNPPAVIEWEDLAFAFGPMSR